MPGEIPFPFPRSTNGSSASAVPSSSGRGEKGIASVAGLGNCARMRATTAETWLASARAMPPPVRANSPPVQPAIEMTASAKAGNAQARETGILRFWGRDLGMGRSSMDSREGQGVSGHFNRSRSSG